VTRGLSVQGDLGGFLNEGPKLIHLDLGEFGVPKEQIVDLLTMEGGNGQPPPDGIELDFQESGGASKSQAIGHQPGAHKNSLLGLRRSKKAIPVRLEKALPQVRHKKSWAYPVLRVR
jgi:hypothetical protein